MAPRHIASLCVIGLITATTVLGHIAPPHFIAKRDSSAEDDSLRKELQSRAEKIPVERYDSDPILHQTVDSVNEKSVYKDPQTDMEYYETDHSDRNKAAVALTGGEDKLPITSGGDKRVFVVMRMSNIEGKPKKYYPSIAYLVKPDSSSAPADLVESKGIKYAVEWAVWNDGVLQGFKYSFQFAVCRYSIIIPCKPELPIANFTGSTSSSQSSATTTEKPKTTEKVEEKYPLNDYSDFFLDLDNKMNGRFQLVGMAFDFLNKAVDGVGALWCGISGMVLGQCHGYDPKDGYTKSQIGTPVIRSDGKIMAAGASEAFGSDGILGTVINSVFTANKDVPKALLNAPPPQDVPIGVQDEEQTIYLNAPPPAKRRVTRGETAPGPRMKGWRTQYAKTIEPNIIFNKDKDIFYGIGHCPPSPKSSADLYDTATTEELIINFYMVLLRNGCISRVKMVIPALKSEGILEFKDKAINVVAGNKLTTESKLTWIEEQKLTSAFEINAVSSAYKESRDKPDPEPKNPLDQKITNSVKFLEKFSVNFITLAKSKAPKHFIRLLRHLVQILRSAMERLGEDSQNLDECSGDCSKDKEILNNDKLAVMGIIKFVMHGFPTADDQVYASLKEFMTKNRPQIETALKESRV
ncbi:uncharacterized protein LOC110849530 isoform X2 [Folsomia candida]|uniref:uncharacterized protein LOC110849530 isoform X2 n=1 Tax=Folsomia candida TaxID=158441 RepID=UPI001604E163|nr:uncharacterized protein LOC110849530 isoform X2 [Folsomia candida]